MPYQYQEILGVDPSLTATGIAVFSDHGIETRLVETKGKRDDSIVQRADRLRHISEQVRKEKSMSVDTLAVIEGPAITRNAGSAWDRAGLWWQIVRLLLERNVAVAVCPPNVRARWATGKGNADKAAVASALARRFDVPVSSSDEADAAVLALIGAHWDGWMGDQPAYSTEALKKVRWPS